MRIFITGASSGIGAEMAKIFAARGATRGLVGRSEEKLAAVKAQLAGTGHEPYAIDVTDREAVYAAARDFESKGAVDTVIATAGISIGVKTEYAEDIDVLERVYRTNVFAMAYAFQPFIEPAAGLRGRPGREAYCSIKAAASSYLDSLRNDVRKYGIDVTTISPGFVRTPLTAKNPYKMPFILDADEFARRAVKAIDAHVSYRTIPWQMGIVAKLLRMLPNGVFDRAVAGRGEKPRAGEL